jgi:glycosyltransferase involved in cell wall biosynthesis
MRIKIQQFLFGANHSWACVGQRIGRELIKLGHDVELISTDGINEKFTPKDLVPYIRRQPTGVYDCQISYTAPHNWEKYLSYGTKNRFAIWNYEYNSKNNKRILQTFGKYYKNTDKVFPSSNFTKEVFLNMGIPEDHMVVIPHGIDMAEFSNKVQHSLKNKKQTRILLNIAQPHKRKALHLALRSFGKAFTSNDNVCLVAKVFKKNVQKHDFDVNFDDLYAKFRKDFPNHAEVELVHDYIENISDIYNSCDVNFSATHAECWHLPSLEAMAAGLVNVVPNYGGQLDFCNERNSLLINGKVVRAPKDHLYWEHSPFAVHFEIDTEDAAKKLQTAVSDNIILKNQFATEMNRVLETFSWKNATEKILAEIKTSSL